MRAVNAVTTSWAGLHADRPSFSAVAESELDAVHRYLLFLTGNRTIAEDLTGETFEKAFRTWRRFDPRRGTPRAWLCRIARSSALDHFRSEEREGVARTVTSVVCRSPSTTTSVMAHSRQLLRVFRRRSARSSRCVCCSSSTDRPLRACSGSA